MATLKAGREQIGRGGLKGQYSTRACGENPAILAQNAETQSRCRKRAQGELFVSE